MNVRLYIRVQISCLSSFSTLKTLGATRVWARTHLCDPTQAEVSVSRGLVTLLSELPAHLPPEIKIISVDGFFCCPTALPPDRKLLRVVVHAGERRWGLKRIVQPSPQIPIEEQLLPQQCGQRRQ